MSPFTHSTVDFQLPLKSPETQHSSNLKSLQHNTETVPVDLGPFLLIFFSHATQSKGNFHFDLPYLTDKGSSWLHHSWPHWTRESHTSCLMSHDFKPRKGPCMHGSAEHRVSFLNGLGLCQMAFQRNIYSIPSLTQKNKIEASLLMSFTVCPTPREKRCWNKWMKYTSCWQKATVNIYPFCWPSSRKFLQAKRTFWRTFTPKYKKKKRLLLAGASYHIEKASGSPVAGKE